MPLMQRCRSLYDGYRAFRTLRRILATMAMLGAVLLPTACADTDTATDPGSARASITIANATDHGIWYVRSRPCGSLPWSGDLARNQVITVGSSRSYGVAPGCSEIRVETTSALGGNAVWEALQLSPGQHDTLRLEQWTFSR